MPATQFLRVNCASFAELGHAAGVQAFPTIHIRKGEKVLEVVQGAEFTDGMPKLKELIVGHLNKPSLSFLGLPDSYCDLAPAIDITQVTCLNEDDDHGNVVANIFSKGGQAFLKSDAGEQLLVHIPFKGECKIHSLKFEAPATGHAPKRVSVFVNRPNLDFSEAEDMKPTQKITLSSASFGPVSIVPLDYVLFQKVSCLTLFIEDNQGDEDETVLHSILIIGIPPTTLDMSDFKRVSGTKGEADH